MRVFKRYFSVTALVIPLLSPAQESDEEYLNWSNKKKLEWADYKGKPDPNSDAAASTTTYLGFEYNILNDKFTYKISCQFSKNKSWGLARTEYILGHEQGHFDIAEIFARKLMKKMSEYQFNRSNYRTEIDKIYNDILDEKEKMQNQYDDETNYSRNKIVQAGWLKKINVMLAELKSYSGYNQNNP